MVRAAVLREVAAPLVVEDIDLPDPGPGQVRLRLAAAGVCHSDLSLARGVLRQRVPAVLGHEGAGTVVALGPGVDGVAVGDRVLVNWAPACGGCWYCEHAEPHLCPHALDAGERPYATRSDGSQLYPGLGAAVFAEETLVGTDALIRLPDDLPLAEAAVVGCAVLTGVGAVLNTAGVRRGDSVLVLGVGGVGLAALQGARIAGADPIVAVDANPAKADLARRNGATDFFEPGRALRDEVRALTGGRGVDHALECVGHGETLRAAWVTTRRGGQTVAVGLGGKDDRACFSALELFSFGSRITGCVFGSADPVRDVPRLLEHWRAGRLRLDDLVTDRIGLDDVEDAFARMGAGRGGRSLVVFE